MDSDVLYVVAVVSNPALFQRRYQLFQEFCARYRDHPRIRLHTVELQQKDRPHAVSADQTFTTAHELWYKENLINLGIANLPSDWKYVAWIDADIEFTNPKWVEETISQLQIYDVLQLFTHCIDMGPNQEVLQVHKGFAYMYNRGETWKPAGYGTHWHPGYAWAIRREAYDAIGGLIDFAILGSADFHMSMGLIGLMDKTLNPHLHCNYRMLLKAWEERCERHIRRNIGHICTTILHHWHGKKKNRFYKERWKILTEHKFDPLRDITKNCQGLWQLEPTKFLLRDDIRRYFRARCEDSIDLE